MTKALRDFFEHEYFSHLIKFALPIALQQLIFSSLNLVSNVMVGQLGDTSLAAVALANQIWFLLNLFVFGICSGAAMFTAQLWGKRDVANIRRVLGLALALALLVGASFMILAEFAPEWVLSIYSKDPAVVAVGAPYLRIFGFSFIFVTISATFALVLRSVGEVRMPVFVSVTALLLNAILSYGLIFGKLGLPELGLNGAALAIVIARLVECILMVSLTYLRRLPPAASLREMFSFDLPFAKTVLKPILPVAVNEVLWSLGITTYTIIYARISTESVAAMNIASTIDGLAVVVFIGLANATAILVGNMIGAGDLHKAQLFAGRSLTLSILGALVVGLLIILVSPAIISLYKISPQVVSYTSTVLLVVGGLLWMRMTNLMLFIGVFRAGGDTVFALLLDGLIIWLVGVPLTAYGAFVLHWPITMVYPLVYSEEFVKWAVGLWRFFSKKWIHNLAETV